MHKLTLSTNFNTSACISISKDVKGKPFSSLVFEFSSSDILVFFEDPFDELLLLFGIISVTSFC